MDVLVARQAILDGQRKLYGYELLFRSEALTNAFDGTEAATATMQVLSNTVMSIGADRLLGGKKAFVNFDHRLLLENMHLTLPRECLVIEILETVLPTKDLVALCKSIQEQGYTLALDDFTDGPDFAPLTRMAGVIKVDMRVSSREEQLRLIQTYKPRGVLMLAEKVETHEEFEWARRAGYDLFQGYFFARPVIMRSQQIPAVKTTCLRLLREIQQPALDLPRVGKLIQEDVSLTYRLLRYANSAMFQRRGRIQSIHRALLSIGEDNIRRWVTLATLPALATNKPPELLKLSLLRANFCERVSKLLPAANANEAFLMGMFSLLDALIDQPIEEALKGLELGKDVTEAILGVAGDEISLTRLFQLIHRYEQGNWVAVEQWACLHGVTAAAIGEAYLDAAKWAEQAVNSPD